MRKSITYSITDLPQFKEALLLWSKRFYEVVWLDSNGHADAYGKFEGVLAVDALTSIETDAEDSFENLKEYQETTQDWIFGYLSYDLKNDVEVLTSQNDDGLGFSDLFFFQPKKLVFIEGAKARFEYLNLVSEEVEKDFNTILAIAGDLEEMQVTKKPPIRIRMRIFKDEYFKRIDQMLAHIYRGDIYEANFCQEFYATDTEIDPFTTYKNLNAISKPPFAAFLKNNDTYVLCASPERYLNKEGTTITSQPIKGTAKRAEDLKEDALLKNELAKDEKERAENIMIVDLVRNDLSKSALKGSVTVRELCKVYTFEQVHQMISTISSEVAMDKNPVEIIKESFPMGSMTGAPKIAAMKIIEELEATKRGVYSGAIGYFSPSNDFDFNVVIRSILYNASEKYVSFSVGGAITAKASPEKEYEECLLKAKAMRQVLENQ